MDRCHRAAVGVILDWVPAHFPTDPHGLARSDGTALYEHEDPRRGFHPDWSTAIFNFGRNEVSNSLIANALYWLDRYGTEHRLTGFALRGTAVTRAATQFGRIALR